MSPGSEEGNERKTTSKFNFSLPGFSSTPLKEAGNEFARKSWFHHSPRMSRHFRQRLSLERPARARNRTVVHSEKKLQGILFLTRPSFLHHHHHYIHCYSQYHQQITVHHQESHLLSLSARKKVWEKVVRDFSSNSEVMTGFGIHSGGGENLDLLTGFSIYSDWWKNRCWMFQRITKSLAVSVWVLKTERDFSANQKGKHSNPKSRTALETRCQLLNLHWKITLPCSVDEIILFCFTPPARQQHSFLETKYLTITVM